MLAERPLSRADLIALSELFARYETHFYGAAETSPAEVEEYVHFVGDLDTDTSAVVRDGRIVAIAAVETSGEGALMVDPADADATEFNERLLGWLGGRRVGRCNVFSEDSAAVGAARRLGWVDTHCAYEMRRPLGDLEPATWPDGVEVGGLDPATDAEAVHRLIYERSDWGKVPGHHSRPLEEWRGWLTLPSIRPHLQIVLRREGRPIGVSRCVRFEDGLGYVMQLAVDRDHRRQGLGRSLLLESFARLQEAGANDLGLGVMAANRGALSLYEGVGLRVTREYLGFAPPADR